MNTELIVVNASRDKSADKVDQHTFLNRKGGNIMFRYLFGVAVALAISVQPALSDAQPAPMAAATVGTNAATPVGAEPSAVDLPACSDMAAQPGNAKQIRLGLAMPGDAALAQHLATLASFYEDVSACAESWSSVLPLATPVTKVSALEKYHGYAAYVLGLLIALVLAWRFTPRAWWRHPTATGILTLVGLTWLSATLMLALANSARLPQRALYASVVSIQLGENAETWNEVDGIRGFDRWLSKVGFQPDFSTQELNLRSTNGAPVAAFASPTASSPAEALSNSLQGKMTSTGKRTNRGDGRTLIEVTDVRGARYWVDAVDVQAVPQFGVPGAVFRVHQALNLRSGVGVDQVRIATLQRGSRVTVTGKRDGDWWEVGTKDVNSGRQQIGWVSSLWLRRLGEGA